MTTTTTVGILVCSSTNNSSIPVVVWANQLRTRQGTDDPWKHTLTYYEFLDDPRWTHLDALLTRLAPLQSLHVASSENLTPNKKKNGVAGGGAGAGTSTKTTRMERLVESLQIFLDSRSDLGGAAAVHQDDQQQEQEDSSIECHVHLHVPVDTSRIESVITQLLVDDADVRLAYRGNVQLAHSQKLQQGLSLWLSAQGLLSNTLDESWTNTFHIHAGVLTSHLTLDRTAAECIHLLPPANAGMASVVGGTPQNNSLLGILSQPCLTKMGRHLMELWLRQPLVDLAQIQQRQDSVECLLGLGKDQLREALQSFSGVDLNQLATTLGQYAATSSGDEDNNDKFLGDLKKPLKALYQLYLLASSKIPQLLEATADLPSFQESSSSPLSQNNDVLPQLLEDARVNLAKLANEFSRCVGLTEAVLDLDLAPREYLVKPTFKDELVELSQELQDVQSQVQVEYERMQEVWTQYGNGRDASSTIRLEEDASDGSQWQFRLPNTNDSKTLQSSSFSSGSGTKIQVHRLLKNGVFFSTLELRQLGSKYQDLKAEYDQHSRKVVKDAMAVACTYQTVVERASDIVAALDVLCALAYVAAYSPHGYCKPTLTDGEDDGMGITVRTCTVLVDCSCPTMACCTRDSFISFLIIYLLPCMCSSCSSRALDTLVLSCKKMSNSSPTIFR
jgi:hypothetical protein